MDIKVLARAMIANKWLLVRVVLNSQCVRAVNNLVNFSNLTNSGGKLASRDLKFYNRDKKEFRRAKFLFDLFTFYLNWIWCCRRPWQWCYF